MPLEINGAGAADQTLLHLSLSEWWALTPCRLFGHSPAPRHSVAPQCPGSKVPPWQPACGSSRMRLWCPSSCVQNFSCVRAARAPSRPADSPEPAKGLPTFHVTAWGAPSAPYTVPHTSAPLLRPHLLPGPCRPQPSSAEPSPVLLAANTLSPQLWICDSLTMLEFFLAKVEVLLVIPGAARSPRARTLSAPSRHPKPQHGTWHPANPKTCLMNDEGMKD